MEREPLLIADNVRGQYAFLHAVRTLNAACTAEGWTTDDPESLTYAATGTEEALEAEREIEASTFTDTDGNRWTLEQVEGGDVFLMPA